MSPLDGAEHCRLPDYEPWSSVLFDWNGTCVSVAKGSNCNLNCRMSAHEYAEYWDDVDDFVERVRHTIGFESSRVVSNVRGLVGKNWGFKSDEPGTLTIRAKTPQEQGRAEITIDYRFSY
jgi:hypothetical protein